MHILFNASNLVVGGALQISTNLIVMAIKDQEIRWSFALSSQVASQLYSLGVTVKGAKIFQRSPARRWKERRRLIALEKELAPDAVLTMAGPAYVHFRATHFMGMHNPYVTHATLPRYLDGGFRLSLTALYQMLNARRADHWFFETISSRKGFCRRFFVSESRTHVIPNTCGARFQSLASQEPSGIRHPVRQPAVILVPSAAYVHKNLDSIVHVAAELQRLLRDQQVFFLLTIPKEGSLWKKIRDSAERLGVGNMIRNRGPFTLAEAPALYEESDLMFLPTLLETFSGSYVEAMAVGIPIVTTDFDFSRDICADAALFYNPDDPRQAANHIRDALFDGQGRQRLVTLGRTRLNMFPAIQERYYLYRDTILRVMNG